MKTLILSFFSLLCLVQSTHGYFSSGGTDIDSVSFIQIGNLTYEEGKLFLTLQIYSLSEEEGGDVREPIVKAYELPREDALNFRELLTELDLFSIRSNDRMRIDVAPFSMRYTIYGVQDTIVAYRDGMSPEEESKWSAYMVRIGDMVDFRHWNTVFREELPDGRYYDHAGMVRRSYVKEGGEWFDLSHYPLYVLDGVVISPLIAQRLPVEEGNYEMEVIKGAAAAAIYGMRGANGVVVFKTKQKQ